MKATKARKIIENISEYTDYHQQQRIFYYQREDVLTELKELERLAKIGKHHDNDKKVCKKCFRCNYLDGICPIYGCKNTEVT